MVVSTVGSASLNSSHFGTCSEALCVTHTHSEPPIAYRHTLLPSYDLVIFSTVKKVPSNLWLFQGFDDQNETTTNVSPATRGHFNFVSRMIDRN